MSSEGLHYVNHSRKLRLVPSAVGNCYLKRSLSLQAAWGHYTPCQVGRQERLEFLLPPFRQPEFQGSG